MIKIINFLFLIVCCGTLGIAQNAATVRYELQAAGISLGEPLMLWIRATNALTSPITIDFGPDFVDNLSISVRRPDGTWKDVPRITRDGPVSTGDIDLSPGGNWQVPLCLSQLVKFDLVGAYVLQIHLRGRPVMVEEKDTAITVNVDPADEARLSAACARLVEEVNQWPSYREAEQAAKALASITGPISPRFIREVMASTARLDWILMDGLKRNPSPEARELLEALRNSTNLERSTLAAGALETRK